MKRSKKNNNFFYKEFTIEICGLSEKTVNNVCKMVENYKIPVSISPRL